MRVELLSTFVFCSELTSGCIDGKNMAEVVLPIGDSSPGDDIKLIGDLIKFGEKGSNPEMRGANPENENLSSSL